MSENGSDNILEEEKITLLVGIIFILIGILAMVLIPMNLVFSINWNWLIGPIALIIGIILEVITFRD